MKTNHCHLGDCRDSMRQMLADGDGGKVQMIVTSPPYWGLRDYGVAGQLGLEPTMQEFIGNMVDVFDLCRELLADDGTLWLNMGDSYAAARGGTTPPAESLAGGVNGHGDDDSKRGRKTGYNPTRDAKSQGLKHKDLCGIPWRLALALQDAGWYLRQDIIWHKPNPMTESVRDRCTKAHEYIFLLSKSERYFFDQEAIKERAAQSSVDRWSQDLDSQVGSDRVPGNINASKGQQAYLDGDEGQRTKAGLLDYAKRSARDSFKREGSKRQIAIPGQTLGTHRPDRDESEFDTAMRNKRSVWTIATESYSEAHFATFPQALVEPCILAGSRPGDIVFDPFLGSGTTAQVAQQLGRNWVGCELNPKYLKLQDMRTKQYGLELASA